MNTKRTNQIILSIAILLAFMLNACGNAQPEIKPTMVSTMTEVATQTATPYPTSTPIPPTATVTLDPCAKRSLPPQATITGPALVSFIALNGNKTISVDHFVKAGESVTATSGTVVRYCETSGPNNLHLLEVLGAVASDQ